MEQAVEASPVSTESWCEMAGITIVDVVDLSMRIVRVKTRPQPERDCVCRDVATTQGWTSDELARPSEKFI